MRAANNKAGAEGRIGAISAAFSLSDAQTLKSGNALSDDAVKSQPADIFQL